MTRALLLAVWFGAFLYWMVKVAEYRAARRRRRDLDDAVNQALRLTQVPPEDRPDWGSR